MSQDILVRMQIPTSPPNEHSDCIIFNKWIPYEDEALLVTQGNIQVKFWCDLTCVSTLSEVDEEYIKNLTNVAVHKFNVDVRVNNLSNQIVQFIYEERDRPEKDFSNIPTNASYQQLSEEYKILGEQVLRAALQNFNKMLSYFRNYKCQYGIKEYTIDFDRMPYYFNCFNAIVKSKTYDWIRWFPSLTDCFTLTILSENTYLKKEEWSEVEKFINERNQPDLISELLANAEFLADNGHERSAIIEAISALEIGIHEFSRYPKYNNFIHPDALARIPKEKLASLVEKLGLRGTISYLIPILFKPEIMPEELINDCQKAVDIRNNVVHNGQREVNHEKVCKMLKSIRNLCMVLKQYSNRDNV